MRGSISLLATIAGCCALSAEITPEKRIELILKENLQTVLNEDGDRREGVIPGMEEMSESERIESLALYLFEASGHPPFSHDIVVPLLNIFPNTIRDDSELRRLLVSEQDARRFHIMRVNLASHFSKHYDATFVSETAHMLLRNDPVSKLAGEASYDPVFQDVSVGTYRSIITYLRKLGASYEDPPDDLPHEQRKLILARWLKENWPGCEHLTLPGDALREVRRPGTASTEAEGLASNRPAAEDGARGSESSMSLKWLLIPALALLAGAILICLRTWRSR